MQLLTIVIPSLAEMQKEGGKRTRAKSTSTRVYDYFFGSLAGFGTIRLLQSQGGAAVWRFFAFQWFITLLSITCGTMLLMWLGEIMSEFDIGNGVSLIIFAGNCGQNPFQFWFFNQLV